MDKTTLVNGTTIGAYRRCDSDSGKQQSDSALCDDIYDNMRMLAYFYPFSDELKENFENGMFIKPNTKAFPHVMKYLFTILDPCEFKKKCCWPLYNKAAEASFRNSSLEFLIKLNAKHKLCLGELKNKIVVFPGGTEFMRIVCELTKLAMRITLKRNGVDASAANQPSLSIAKANRKLQEVQMLYDNVMAYTEKLNSQASELKEKAKRIRESIANITEGTNITSADILERDFCANWQQTQNQIVVNGVQPHVERLAAFRINCERLESKIDAMVKKRPIKYDANEFAMFIDGMQKLYPTHFQQLSNCANQHHINMNDLLLAFQLALPLMLNDVHTNKPRSLDVIGYEAKGVEKLAMQLNNIVRKTVVFDTQINQIIGNCDGATGDGKLMTTKNTNNMKLMIFATPPISVAAIKRREKTTKRISLMAEHFEVRKKMTFNTTLRPIRSMPIEEEPKTNGETFTSPLCGRSTYKLNPMHLLRTIEQNSRFRPLANRLKRIESPKSSAHHSKEHYTLPMIDSNSDISSTSLVVGRETIHEKQSLAYLLSPTEHQSSVDIQTQLSPVQSVLRKRPLMPHIDQQSESHNDINRSPSGRLQLFSLAETNAVTSNKSAFNVSKEIEMKKVQLSPMNLSTSTQISFSKPSPIPLITATTMVNRSNIENNPNANNINTFTLFHLINENEESLLNISDSILASTIDCSRIE